MILAALRNQWPDRVVSWNHTGEAPPGHVAFADLDAMDEWKSAHPELAPQPQPPTAPVPDEVPMWALKEACLVRGHTAVIESALSGLPNPAQAIVRNRWENKDTISRGSPYISALRQVIGWTEAYVDELFRAANILSQ